MSPWWTANLWMTRARSSRAARWCRYSSAGACSGRILSSRGTRPRPNLLRHITNPRFRKGVIPDGFKDKYDILINIRNDLEKLSLTQAWSLRETDLYDFQRQL